VQRRRKRRNEERKKDKLKCMRSYQEETDTESKEWLWARVRRSESDGKRFGQDHQTGSSRL
jgi:hypothetical protein